MPRRRHSAVLYCNTRNARVAGQTGNEHTTRGSQRLRVSASTPRSTRCTKQCGADSTLDHHAPWPGHRCMMSLPWLHNLPNMAPALVLEGAPPSGQSAAGPATRAGGRITTWLGRDLRHTRRHSDGSVMSLWPRHSRLRATAIWRPGRARGSRWRAHHNLVGPRSETHSKAQWWQRDVATAPALALEGAPRWRAHHNLAGPRSETHSKAL